MLVVVPASGNFSPSLTVSNGNCLLSDVWSSTLPCCNADKALENTGWVVTPVCGLSHLYF